MNSRNEGTINNRAYNSSRNLISGIAVTIVISVFPFILRTLMAHILGDGILGLNSLYMSFLSLLNISEMGIGSVMVYYLYEPVAKKNTDNINRYLQALKKMYQAIGVIVFAGGVILTPFIGAFISGERPQNVNIYVLFLIYLLATGLQYFLYPEALILFDAFQRNDICNKISLVSSSILYILQIVSLVILKNYYIYIIAVLIQTLLMAYLRKNYSEKFFPEYVPRGVLNNEEKKDIKKSILSMIGHQIDEKLLNSIDNVFISSILGLSAVAVYGNYFYVITAISMFFNVLYNSVLSSIGNAIVTESKESNYVRFKSLFWLNSCLAGWASCCMLCLYQNFIMLWMGDRLLGMDMVILFCIYFYLSQVRRTVLTFKNACGMWWNDKLKPYISILADLLMDVILINLIGIKGAILSSIICIGIIEIPWETRVLFRDFFKKSVVFYYLRLLEYSCVSIVISIVIYYCCDKFIPIMGLISMIERMVICLVSSLLFVVIYIKTPEIKMWKDTLRRLIMRK